MNIKKIYQCIENEINELKRPVIIGVNGAVTSGKTRFAGGLSGYLNNGSYNTQMISIDDFHNKKSVRFKDNSPEHYFRNAINTGLFKELIKEIKSGPVNKTMKLLNMGSDEYSDIKTFRTDVNSVVIVEGVFLYTPAISDLFDYKIYLHIDHEEILRRGNMRDVPLYGEAILKQYKNLFIPVQKLYETDCSPKEQSNLVIDNNVYDRPVII